MSTIARYWRRFIDELARLLEPLLAGRARRRYVLVDRGGRYEAFVVDGKGASLVGSGTLEAVAGALRRHPVDFRLAPEGVMSRVLTLPAASRDYLDAVLRNQIERLTPWPVDRVAFGYAVGAGGAPAGQISVRVVATARETLTAALARLAGAGIRPVSVGVATDPVERAPEVRLPVAGGQAEGETLRRRLSVTVLAIFAACLAFAGWSAWSLARENTRSTALESALEVQRTLLGRVVARTTEAEDGQALVALRRDAVPMAVLLEELSALIPDDTYLTEFAVENGEVRLQGLSPDATALIALLEDADLLEGVDFAAATTRDPDTARDSFNISARLVLPAPAAAP